MNKIASKHYGERVTWQSFQWENKGAFCKACTGSEHGNYVPVSDSAGNPQDVLDAMGLV